MLNARLLWSTSILLDHCNLNSQYWLEHYQVHIPVPVLLRCCVVVLPNMSVLPVVDVPVDCPYELRWVVVVLPNISVLPVVDVPVD